MNTNRGQKGKEVDSRLSELLSSICDLREREHRREGIINCEQATAMICTYAAGELNAPDALALEKHLPGCLDCRLRFDSLANIGLASVPTAPRNRASEEQWLIAIGMEVVEAFSDRFELRSIESIHGVMADIFRSLTVEQRQLAA